MNRTMGFRDEVHKKKKMVRITLLQQFSYKHLNKRFSYLLTCGSFCGLFSSHFSILCKNPQGTDTMQHGYIYIQKAFVSCTSEMILQQGTFSSDLPVQSQNPQTTPAQTTAGMHTNISVISPRFGNIPGTG